jgi:hypothetical protein
MWQTSMDTSRSFLFLCLCTFIIVNVLVLSVLKVIILWFSYQIDVKESFLFLGCCHDD